MAALPRLSNRAARALFLDRHGLASAVAGPGRGRDLAGVVGALGFVQIDSINTVARAHHMILHARRTEYRPANLHLLHDRDRGVFEHWTHDASMIDMAHFPHWRLRFRRHAIRAQDRWRLKGRPAFVDKLEDVLRQVAVDGPCTSADVGADEARPTGGWWDWHPSKAAMEHLWRIGQLSVTRRTGFRKVYDLTENVIPADRLRPRPDEAETIDWACAAALDRLGFATPGELAAFWALVTPAEARLWAEDALARGDLAVVGIEQADGRVRRSLARPATLAAPLPDVAPRLRILSPFDPALRDRDRSRHIFGFDYRIEVFVPEARRRYGYYVFPVLEADRLIGRIDMKAERDGDRLHIRALWPEPGIRFGAGRTARLHGALDRTARFAGVSRVTFHSDWVRQPEG